MTREELENAAIKVIVNRYRIKDVILSGQALFQFGKDCFADGAEWQAKQSPWISTEEQLPEIGKKVLTLHRADDKIDIRIMRRVLLDLTDPNYGWRWSLTGDKHGIIAWMPIPYFEEKHINITEKL